MGVQFSLLSKSVALIQGYTALYGGFEETLPHLPHLADHGAHVIQSIHSADMPEWLCHTRKMLSSVIMTLTEEMDQVIHDFGEALYSLSPTRDCEHDDGFHPARHVDSPNMATTKQPLTRTSIVRCEAVQSKAAESGLSERLSPGQIHGKLKEQETGLGRILGKTPVHFQDLSNREKAHNRNEKNLLSQYSFISGFTTEARNNTNSVMIHSHKSACTSSDNMSHVHLNHGSVEMQLEHSPISTKNVSLGCRSDKLRKPTTVTFGMKRPGRVIRTLSVDESSNTTNSLCVGKTEHPGAFGIVSSADPVHAQSKNPSNKNTDVATYHEKPSVLLMGENSSHWLRPLTTFFSFAFTQLTKSILTFVEASESHKSQRTVSHRVPSDSSIQISSGQFIELQDSYTKLDYSEDCEHTHRPLSRVPSIASTTESFEIIVSSSNINLSDGQLENERSWLVVESSISTSPKTLTDISSFPSINVSSAEYVDFNFSSLVSDMPLARHLAGTSTGQSSHSQVGHNVKEWEEKGKDEYLQVELSDPSTLHLMCDEQEDGNVSFDIISESSDGDYILF